MTKARIASLALLLAAFLLIPGLAFSAPPQNPSGKASARQTLTLTGTVTEKGALLRASADQKLYRVLNSETLRHLEGQLVTLKARILPEKGLLYVEAVRAESSAPNDAFRLSDAAFRR
jgi:hypothetical protein